MFVVLTYVKEFHRRIEIVHGIVYNEADFDRFLAETYFKSKPKPAKNLNKYGDLSISYNVHFDTEVAMVKIEEIGQPKY